jgi:hypothetical protein
MKTQSIGTPRTAPQVIASRAAGNQGKTQGHNLFGFSPRRLVVTLIRFLHPSTGPVCGPALLRALVTVLAVLIFGHAASGQGAKIQIDHLEKLANKAAEVVDVTLDGPMLRLAARFMDKDDKDDAEMKRFIRDLKGIYVKSFEFDREGEYSELDLEAIRTQLHAPEWRRIVGVESKHERERSEIYLMGSGDNVKGMAIIAAEPKELTVVNLVGPIDVEQLSKLEGHLGVPQLGVKPDQPPRATKPPATQTRPRAPSPAPLAEGGPHN